MMPLLKAICVVAACLLPSVVFCEVDYPYKKVDDFKPLSSYKSVEEFEKSIDIYMQHCLDHTGGGTGGKPCFVAHFLWDRELNTYYNSLMKVLGERERNLLKDSQRPWIKEREKTIAFNSSLFDLDEEYATTGTMGALLRAGNADRLMTPIVKHRALLLKEWLQFTTREKRKK